MLKNKVEISIIIVHYNVKKELFDCIRSIYHSKPRINFELLVVDNEDSAIVKMELEKKFPKAIYLKNINNGWGGGINIGAKHASGNYLYFLNPDTIVLEDAIDKVYEFAKSKLNIGIASSILLDVNKKPYLLQGTKHLTPLNAIIALSYINKLFPKNPISSSFWLKDWNKREPRMVEIAPLSAALISSSVFKKSGGFDEKYFLYFEEYDFGRIIKKMGLVNYIVPQSKVIHIWEASTKKTGKTDQYMKESRIYYFKKNFGLIQMLFVELVIENMSKKILVLISLVFIIIISLLIAYFF